MRVTYNDFVIRFANVNGSGSASANGMFAKALFRMGIPTAGRNIFPSNIQGLPTWFEVRVNEQGYLGRREGVDIMVAMNAETLADDIASIKPGGYLFYDNSKPLARIMQREDIIEIGMPISTLLLPEFSDPKQRGLSKNIVYLGALSALLNIEFEVITGIVSTQYKDMSSIHQIRFELRKMSRKLKPFVRLLQHVIEDKKISPGPTVFIRDVLDNLENHQDEVTFLISKCAGVDEDAEKNQQRQMDSTLYTLTVISGIFTIRTAKFGSFPLEYEWVGAFAMITIWSFGLYYM